MRMLSKTNRKLFNFIQAWGPEISNTIMQHLFHEAQHHRRFFVRMPFKYGNQEGSCFGCGINSNATGQGNG